MVTSPLKNLRLGISGQQEHRWNHCARSDDDHNRCGQSHLARETKHPQPGRQGVSGDFGGGCQSGFCGWFISRGVAFDIVARPIVFQIQIAIDVDVAIAINLIS